MNIDLRVDAGAVRPFIQDADDGNRVAVLNPAGEIKFTGHGHDRFRFVFHDDSPGQGPPRGDGDFHLILVGELNQIFDFTFPASFAVLHISSDLDLTFKIMDAVREENQKPVGASSVGIRSNEMIIQLNEGLLHLLLGHPEQPSHRDHEGEEDFCDQPSQFVRKEDVLSPENGEDEEKPSGEHEKDEHGEDQRKEKRKVGMDVPQPHHGHIPEHKDQKEQDQTGDDQKTDKDSFLRLRVQSTLPRSNVKCQMSKLKVQIKSKAQISKMSPAEGRVLQFGILLTFELWYLSFLS